jgi:hypothetical protein
MKPEKKPESTHFGILELIFSVEQLGLGSVKED